MNQSSGRSIVRFGRVGRFHVGTVALIMVAALLGCSNTADQPSVGVSTSAASSAPVSTSTPVVSSAPVASSAPVTTAQTPVSTTQPPVSTSPAPVTDSPAPVTDSPAPVTDSPAPVTDSPSVSLPQVGIAGVNDPGCRSRQRPVLLLPGTFSTIASNYADLAPALIAAGYCVFGLNFGVLSTQRVRTSAAQTAQFIDDLHQVIDFQQLDVVGYSQGGLVLRTALRENGLSDQVHTAVLIAAAFHGTTSPLLDLTGTQLCPACLDLRADSELLRELDTGGDLDGRVRYAAISSTRDTNVTPLSAQIPVGPADRVHATLLQDLCPNKSTLHESLPYDPAVISWVVTVLDADGQPSADGHWRTVDCGPR